MGLFVAAAPELVKEKRKNKKAGGGGKDVEKRTEVVMVVVVVEKCRREAMNAKERESEKELVFTLHCCCWRSSLSACAPQIDSEVITSCAWRQRQEEVTQALIRRALAR